MKKNKQKLKPRRRLSEQTNEPSSRDNFRRNQMLSNGRGGGRATKNSKAPLVDQTPRMITHDLSTKRRHVFALFLVVIFIAILLWLLLFNFTAEPVVSIDNRNDTVKTIDDSRYEQALQEYLNSNPAYRLTLINNVSTMSNYIENKLPEVAKVSQGGSAGFGKTVFVITLRKPVADWKINNKQYYVDSNGVQFELNYFAEPEVQIIDESGVSVNTSGTVTIASRRFLSFVGRAVSLSKSYGYTVTKAILPANTTRELEINIKEKKYLIKLSIDRLAGEQIEDMKNSIHYFDQKGLSPEYIDLRVSGRAFYK